MSGDNQSDSGDRKGDRRSDLSRVIDGASHSAMDEVLDAWGPPPSRTRTQVKPARTNYELEHHGEQGEKLLLKTGIQEQQEKPNESLDTNQIGMMALSGHPVAQAGAEMLKTPAAQDKKVRDGIKRDISGVLGDWFKEQFQNVTNLATGFDKWVTSALNVQNLRNFGEGIRKAAFGHHDSDNEPIRDKYGDLQRKGVKSPQDVAKYGVSTAVGVTKALSHAAPLLTPQGFAKVNHELADGGREAIKNAGEYYGEHGVSKLPADTADATKTAYNRLGQWSADRMQMEPGERGDVTGAAMAVVFFIAASREFIDENGLAKRLGIGSDDLASMTDEQLEAQGIRRMAAHEGRDWAAAGKTTADSVSRKLDGYLLNPAHSKGGPKARWLKAALGFDCHNGQELAKQLVFDESKAIAKELTEFGQKYEQIIDLVGANGNVIPTPVMWIKNHDNVTRLVTLIPVGR